VKFL
jgi:putative transposase